eukprot:COSAG02_NODE_4377_length_5435_cov_3.316342_3_plen_52_part_00
MQSLSLGHHHVDCVCRLRLDDLFAAWDAWPGMADVVAEERAIEAKLTPAKL